MEEAGNFDVGVAGSLTMIFLTLAMVFLKALYNSGLATFNLYRI